MLVGRGRRSVWVEGKVTTANGGDGQLGMWYHNTAAFGSVQSEQAIQL